MTFNFDKLRGMVRAKKEREGLAYRDIFVETGVAATTVCNFIHGRNPDADTTATLAAWVGLSLAHFTNSAEPVKLETNGETLESVKRVLQHDPSLRPRDRKGLMTILRTAYERVLEK